VQWIISTQNPVQLAGNLSNLYSYSQHATHCFLGVDHTQDVVKRLKAVKAPHKFFEDPSELGHYIYWEPHCYERAISHVAAKVKKNPYADIRYTTYSLRYPGAYWAEATRFVKWGDAATFRARKIAKGSLSVESENVASLRLRPPAEWAAEDGTFRVAWNGQTSVAQAGEHGHIRLTHPKHRLPEDAGPVKSQAVCGPASDVLNYPFIAVRGTTGTAAETAAATQLAEHFARDWSAHAEGKAVIVRDTDVTDKIIAAKGLILFGLPETNAIVKRIAGKLPFTLSRKGVSLPDGKTFAWDGVGMALTYPNPLAPDRYVLIFHGEPWGDGRPPNHKFDYIPDFTIYTRETVPEIGINRFLAAGLFNERWQYDPKLTDFEGWHAENARRPLPPLRVPDLQLKR
jgi:hypothetical protein